MYNFDEIIDRRNTNALNTDGFRSYIFHADNSMTFPYRDEEFIRMWVADMEFATPQVIIDGIKERLDKRIFGYTRIFSKDYYNAFVNWCSRRYGWNFEKKHLVMSNGIIPALYELVDYICEPENKVLFLTPSYAYFKYAAGASMMACPIEIFRPARGSSSPLATTVANRGPGATTPEADITTTHAKNMKGSEGPSMRPSFLGRYIY